MEPLNYQSPTTPTPRRWYLWISLLSIVVALVQAAVPLPVILDMNRECVRTAWYGEDDGSTQTLAVPPAFYVAPRTYFRVRYAVFMTCASSLLLLIAAVVSVRHPNRFALTHLIWLILHAALLTWLIITAHRFSAELDWRTSRRDWLFHTPYGSSVRATAAFAAATMLAYPAFLILLVLARRFPRFFNPVVLLVLALLTSLYAFGGWIGLVLGLSIHFTTGIRDHGSIQPLLSALVAVVCTVAAITFFHLRSRATQLQKSR